MSGENGSSGSSGIDGTDGFLLLEGTTDNGFITYNSSTQAGTVESNVVLNTSGTPNILEMTGAIEVSSYIYSPNFQERYVNLGTGNTAVSFNLSAANNFRFQFNGTTTISFTSPPATNAFGFTMVLTNGGGYTITWPASVLWANGIAPVLSAAGSDVLVFYTYDGGSTYYGFLAGSNLS